jgi:hypothetical protein
MDLAKQGFEVCDALPRELNVNELLGRRLYVDLKNKFTQLDTVGEPADWSTYSLRLGPYQISFEQFKQQSGISYRYNRLTNVLYLSYSSSVTPIESRTLTQHLMNEINKWQKKQKA